MPCLILKTLVLLLGFNTAYAAPLNIPILYIEQELPKSAVLSNIFPKPSDEGLKGAELGISDNNTTGRFLKHDYSLEASVSDEKEALITKLLDWVEQGNSLVVANLPSETLLAIANHPQLKNRILLFNAGSADSKLRSTLCQTGLLHTLPSRAMLADALAQFLIRKRWNEWFVVQGQRPEDLLYSQALTRSAKRFGGKIVAQKTWSFKTDIRRNAQQEIPLFTQAKDYDVVVVADETGDIGEFVPYNTWLPRPVVGTQGLMPLAWHRVVEQWGARQLQSRFESHAARWMNGKDYAAWLAVRSIGEAVTRTGSINSNDIYSYLLGDHFEIAAFKGRKLNYRQWNGQIRQPIALVQPRALVSQSPQEGFLHPRTDLDTLGFDEPEVQCEFKTQLGAL